MSSRSAGPRTNLASLARGILEWAERRGLDRPRLLRASQLDPALLEREDTRIPSEGVVAIWREIERMLDDASFGLKSAETILKPSSLGVVGLLAMTSRNVGESIERSVRYSRVLKEDVIARSHVTNQSLVVELKTFSSSPRAIIDVSMAAFRHFMEEWTGQPVAVKEVYFQHARPHDAAEYERLFPCPVHFDHPTNAIVFDREVADIPLRTAQPEIAVYLDRVAQGRLADLERRAGPPDLEVTLATAIREALAHGDVRIVTVARRMGMSARTLQRALVHRNIEYRRLVDEARLAVAAPLVTQTDEPIERIAERLGYAEAKAFRRAFRRWTGSSPQELRRTSTMPRRTP